MCTMPSLSCCLLQHFKPEMSWVTPPTSTFIWNSHFLLVVLWCTLTYRLVYVLILVAGCLVHRRISSSWTAPTRLPGRPAASLYSSPRSSVAHSKHNKCITLLHIQITDHNWFDFVLCVFLLFQGSQLLPTHHIIRQYLQSQQRETVVERDYWHEFRLLIKLQLTLSRIIKLGAEQPERSCDAHAAKVL